MECAECPIPTWAGGDIPSWQGDSATNSGEFSISGKLFGETEEETAALGRNRSQGATAKLSSLNNIAHPHREFLSKGLRLPAEIIPCPHAAVGRFKPNKWQDKDPPSAKQF